MPPRIIRLKPPPQSRLGDYDVDGFVLEVGETPGDFDFRIELGAGLGIYWALPAAPNDRLRLVHVDGAAYVVDPPELVDDPWIADGSLKWAGRLGMLADGSALRSVSLELQSTPARYLCRIATDRAAEFVRSWSDSAPSAAPEEPGRDQGR